ncbi:MAG: NUDIX domain-containing protein [Phycisphaerales bacterium]|jgi:8-oxo-dGTP pyrophosphatase MutT (NUDIX family)|nr:NUDIX domain-containing protein [Phycisphaerales bacterium]
MPDSHLRAEAEAEWLRRTTANPHLHDGWLIQVAGVHRNGHGGAAIQGFRCSYRWYAVQAGGLDVGCRPLGVKGVTRFGDKVLFGKRASWTAHAPGLWELAPSGGVEPGDRPEESIVAELAEEVGVEIAAPPRADAVIFDPAALSWEVVLTLSASSEVVDPKTTEYESLVWAHPTSRPGPLTGMATRILESLRPSERQATRTRSSDH